MRVFMVPTLAMSMPMFFLLVMVVFGLRVVAVERSLRFVDGSGPGICGKRLRVR